MLERCIGAGVVSSHKVTPEYPKRVERFEHFSARQK